MNALYPVFQIFGAHKIIHKIRAIIVLIRNPSRFSFEKTPPNDIWELRLVDTITKAMLVLFSLESVIILVAEILVINPYMPISKPTNALNNLPITQHKGDDMESHYWAYLINATNCVQVRNKLLITAGLGYIKQPYSMYRENFNYVP